MDRFPMPLCEEDANALTADTIDAIKRTDCSMYNECLDQALLADWSGFSCEHCKAYQAITAEQRELDVERLLTAHIAAERLEKNGCVDRKRGVKPGADAKVNRYRLNVIKECAEKEVPTALVLP